MYSPVRLAFKYFQYCLRASSSRGHGIHSPFVFEFVTKVLNDKTVYADYRPVEELRQRLLKNKTWLNIDDLGAGSAVSKNSKRTIASVAKSAAKPGKFGQLLYRMIKYYQPATIVELGTSLGITTSYLAMANPGSGVITLEGANAVATVASENFRNLKLQNIELTKGNFDDTLSPVVDGLSSVDFTFIDGNHRLQPTIQYFETILRKAHNFSIVILDDIHWSEEMEQAWKYCKDHSSVTLSIDLFFIGILIFRKEIKEKQHFIVRF